MITYKHQYITILIIITCNSIIGMEHQQLQLEKQQPIKHVNYSLMISSPTNDCVKYSTQKFHATSLTHNKTQSTIKDPILFLQSQNSPNHSNSKIPLPAKLFINCTNKSTFHIHVNGDPILKKTPVKITVTCTKNPNLEGDSFAEQFNNAMNEFYKNPRIYLGDEEHRHELETAEIITSTPIHVPRIMAGPQGPTFVIAQYIMLKHGPNGCPDEKTFIQSIIDDKIPQNMSYFKALKNRELTGSFGR